MPEMLKKMFCALCYLFRALPQVSYDINDLHRLKFHAYMSSLLKKLNGVKVVVPNAFMYPHIYALGYNDHFIYFVLIFFTVAF